MMGDRLLGRRDLVGDLQKNFFETRVTEYQSAALLRWDA